MAKQGKKAVYEYCKMMGNFCLLHRRLGGLDVPKWDSDEAEDGAAPSLLAILPGAPKLMPAPRNVDMVAQKPGEDCNALG